MTVFVRWFLRMRSVGMPTAPHERFALLDETREELERATGDWRVPWGAVNRLQRRHWSGAGVSNEAAPSLPVAGGPGWIGIVFNFYTGPLEPGGRAYGVMGNSYVSVVEFGDKPRALSIVQFGQSGDPRSPHYFDQAPLYARGEFKQAWWTRDQVLAAAGRSYRPGE
jgi:penicillin amidase